MPKKISGHKDCKNNGANNTTRTSRETPLRKAYPSIQYIRIDTKGKFYQTIPSNSSELGKHLIPHHPYETANRRIPTSPVVIQQPTVSKATTKPTSETDEQQSTVKNEFYII